MSPSLTYDCFFRATIRERCALRLRLLTLLLDLLLGRAARRDSAVSARKSVHSVKMIPCIAGALIPAAANDAQNVSSRYQHCDAEKVTVALLIARPSPAASAVVHSGAPGAPRSHRRRLAAQRGVLVVGGRRQHELGAGALVGLLAEAADVDEAEAAVVVGPRVEDAVRGERDVVAAMKAIGPTRSRKSSRAQSIGSIANVSESPSPPSFSGSRGSVHRSASRCIAARLPYRASRCRRRRRRRARGRSRGGGGGGGEHSCQPCSRGAAQFFCACTPCLPTQNRAGARRTWTAARCNGRGLS